MRGARDGPPSSSEPDSWPARACCSFRFPTWIARLFSPDPVVIRTGARLLLVAAAFQLFDGLQTVATGALDMPD